MEATEAADKAKILIVDDEESMRDSCNQVLSKEGYVVRTAEDGVVGFKEIQNHPPDLVLVDLKMPGMGGMELLAKTRELDPNIVSVVITGYATLESAVEAMQRGAYDFLPKPFTPDELRIIVKRGLERRKLVLQATALQEEKERMRRFFITLVTHQLRGPIASVIQSLEALLVAAQGTTTQDHLRMMGRMKDRLSQLLTLTNDWLSLSKIEEGRLVESFQPLSLQELVLSVIEFFRPTAETKRVTLRTQISSATPEACGDPASLREVIANLVANAIKFNKEGGEVVVTLAEENNHFEIRVSDTGVGIDSEHLPFLFDEFYRVNSSRTKGIEGSGLGLSIAKKIVEAHRGSITVESTVGKGSTFTVCLPRLEGARPGKK